MLREAPPAFLFFGVISGRRELLAEMARCLEERFGRLHARGRGPTFPFPETRTYRPTMGAGLLRQFFVLDELWPQDSLGAVKRLTVELEREMRDRFPGSVPRPVNIDPGLVNDCRVILASTKDYAHRIYRGGGVWEEITLLYRSGAYQELPWTYPDFRQIAYHRFFESFREELLARIGVAKSRGAPRS